MILTEDDIKKIKHLRKNEKLPLAIIAKRFGVNPGTIGSICSKERPARHNKRCGDGVDEIVKQRQYREKNRELLRAKAKAYYRKKMRAKNARMKDETV